MLARIHLVVTSTMTVEVDSIAELYKKGFEKVGEMQSHCHHGEKVKGDIELMIEEGDKKHWVKF